MLTYGRKIIKLRLIKFGGVIKYVNVGRKLFYKYCCLLKVFDRYKIRAGFLARNSAL